MNKQLESQYFVEDYIVDNMEKTLPELLELKDEALIEEHLGAILLKVQDKILQDTTILDNFSMSIPRILSNPEENNTLNPLLLMIEDSLLLAVKVGYLLNSGSIRKSLKESSLRTAIRVPDKVSNSILTKIKRKLTNKKKKGRRAEDEFRKN